MFAEISNKKVIAENQCEKHKKLELSYIKLSLISFSNIDHSSTFKS